eukprot:snap_masked-scaffold_69-processed-gene-0.3-mRNA-1 protein AED:1.00 eAED:1.00 QI:0/-1/0/0/-1/1/1/0/802
MKGICRIKIDVTDKERKAYTASKMNLCKENAKYTLLNELPAKVIETRIAERELVFFGSDKELFLMIQTEIKIYSTDIIKQFLANLSQLTYSSSILELFCSFWIELMTRLANLERMFPEVNAQTAEHTRRKYSSLNYLAAHYCREAIHSSKELSTLCSLFTKIFLKLLKQIRESVSKKSPIPESKLKLLSESFFVFSVLRLEAVSKISGKSFNEEFMKSTEEFYKEFAVCLKQEKSSSLKKYLNYYKTVLKFEENKVASLMKPKVGKSMLRSVRRIIFIDEFDFLLENYYNRTFKKLIQEHGHTNGTAFLAFKTLFSEIEGDKQLILRLQRVIEMTMEKTFSSLAEKYLARAPAYTQKAMKNIFWTCFLVRECFKNSDLEADIVKLCTSKVCSSVKFSFSFALAAFINEILINQKSLERIEVFRKTDVIKTVEELAVDVILFSRKLLKNADIFELELRRFLLKRLLFNYHDAMEKYNLEFEFSIILALSNELGSEYISKMKIMLNDFKESLNLKQAFDNSEFRENCNPQIEFCPSIVTHTSWPLDEKVSTSKLPRALQPMQQNFKTFFEKKFDNIRELNWSHEYSTCVMKINFLKSPVDVLVSLDQAVILLLFNEKDFLTLEDVTKKSNLSITFAEENLESLCIRYLFHSKTAELKEYPGILRKNEDGTFEANPEFENSYEVSIINFVQYKFVSESNKISLTEFAKSLKRLSLDRNSMSPQKEKREDKGLKAVDQERKERMDACLVSCLKAAKKLKKDELTKMVMIKLGTFFPISLEELGNRLSSLEQRKYLKHEDGFLVYLT